MLAVDGPRGGGDVSESIFLQSSVRMFFSLFSVPPVLSFAAPYARSRRLRERRDAYSVVTDLALNEQKRSQVSN